MFRTQGIRRKGNKDLVNIRQAAALNECMPGTIEKLVRDGKLDNHSLGTKPLISKQEVSKLFMAVRRKHAF